MTLYEIYKRLCNILDEEPIKNASEMKTYNRPITEDIQFTNVISDREKLYDSVARIYYDIKSSLGSNRTTDLWNKRFNDDSMSELIYTPYPDRQVTLNTIISIYILHGYDEVKSFKKTIKYLFKD